MNTQLQQAITLQITRKSKRVNLTIRPDGAKELCAYICNELLSMALAEGDNGSRSQAVDELLDRFFRMHKERSGRLAGIIVESKDIQSTLLAQKSGDSHIEESSASYALNHDGNFEKFTEVVDSFDIPAYIYNGVRKVYHLDPAARGLLAEAADKSQQYQDRVGSVSQRVARNSMFVAESFNVQKHAEKVVISTVGSLISSTGKVCVLGMLTEQQEGVWYLEENTGSIQIDLSKAQVLSGFLCSGTVILAEGSMIDGVFVALTVGLPPSEPREDTLLSFPELEWFGTSNGVADVDRKRTYLQSVLQTHLEARVVVVSEIHLDQEATIMQLKSFFAVLQQNPPDQVVMMGNFFSSPVSMVAAKERFDMLAALIAQYKQLSMHCMWIFLPGPTDPGVSSMLPQAPLLPSLTTKLKQSLKKVHFLSNPARILYFGKEIVLFRYDLLQKLRRHAVLHPSAESSATSLTGVVCDTICSQGHLLPLLVEQHGVFWEFDHALALTPLPHYLVLADTVEPYEWPAHDTTHVCSPGDFSKEACCMTIFPSQDVIQFNTLSK